MSPSAAVAFCATVALAANTALGLQVTEQNTASEVDGLYLDCSWNGSVAKMFHFGNLSLPRWPCTQRPRFPAHRKTIVCIGDSITHGSKVTREESYPANLFGLFHRKFNVLNLGVGGATVQEAPTEAYRTLPHLKVALETPFDVAIVQLGTNDAKDRNWVESRFKRDYLRLIRQLVRTHPQARIILSIPPPAADNDFKIQPDVVNNRLREAISGVRLEAGLSAVNMQRAFLGEEDHEQLLQRDGVHPTAAGYRIMAAAFADLLRIELTLPSAF